MKTKIKTSFSKIRKPNSKTITLCKHMESVQNDIVLRLETIHHIHLEKFS